MAQKIKTYSIELFSKHLFWDVDNNKLSFDKNKKFIIHRVLDYGLINDWQIIYNYYGLKEITEIAKTIKDLDIKSANFISLLSNVPKEQFLCFTLKPSVPTHCNF